MKTNFNIAWVDDNFSDSQMSSSILRLSRKLSRNNSFRLSTDDVYTAALNGNLDTILGDLASKIDLSNSVDLVVVDYELGDVEDANGIKLTGEVFAKRFRDALPTVDIVFYSGKKNASELRAILANANVDCVNCIGRSELVDDTYMIIKNVIDRSCKISTLRGLILNSVCEMDDMIVGILTSYYLSKNSVIRNDFISKVANYAGRNASEKSTLINSAITDLLRHKKIMSGTLFIYLKDIRNDIGLSDEQLSLIDKYQAEILDLRTSAAHAKEDKCKKTGQSMLRNNNTQAEYKKSDINDICKHIVAHENNIKLILSSMP